MGINEAFAEITGLAEKLGFKNLDEHPGLWEYEIDDKWKVKVNWHDEMVDLVQGHHCLVLYHGWPVGMFHRLGGWMTWGPIKNAQVFMEAVRKRAAELKKSSKSNHIKRGESSSEKINDLGKEYFDNLNYWTRLDD